MKRFALVVTLACLTGLPLAGCALESRGVGDSFWYQSSRTEMGFGRRNDARSNDATSEDDVRVPMVEDAVRSVLPAPATVVPPADPDDDGSRS